MLHTSYLESTVVYRVLVVSDPFAQVPDCSQSTGSGLCSYVPFLLVFFDESSTGSHLGLVQSSFLFPDSVVAS